MAVVPSFIPGGDKVNSFVSNLLDGFEVGIETISRVDYAAQYLWTIDFIGDLKPPKPFDRFFPASDISFQGAIVNSLTFEMGQRGFSIPRNSSPKSIDITFYDNETHDLQKWMTEWVELDIFNNGEFVSGINDIHTSVGPDSFSNTTRRVSPKRQIRIVLLDRFQDEALVYNYFIVPDGEINIVGSQSSEASTFAVKFNIVEELKTKKKESLGAKKFIKTALQRFI